MKGHSSLLWHLSSSALIKSSSTERGELFDKSIWLTYADAKISPLATATTFSASATHSD